MRLRVSGALRWTANIEAEDEAERANIEVVSRHMNELMRLPTVVAGAIMPDACPSDHRLGAIPVGGVAASRDAIHPGMHSADICCSMGVTIFDSGSDAGSILDAGMKLSHFGAGGRAAGGPPPGVPRDARAQCLDSQRNARGHCRGKRFSAPNLAEYADNIYLN